MQFLYKAISRKVIGKKCTYAMNPKGVVSRFHFTVTFLTFEEIKISENGITRPSRMCLSVKRRQKIRLTATVLGTHLSGLSCACFMTSFLEIAVSRGQLTIRPFVLQIFYTLTLIQSKSSYVTTLEIQMSSSKLELVAHK